MLSHLEDDAATYDDIDLSTLWVSCENLFSSRPKADTSGLDPEEEADTPCHIPRLVANRLPNTLYKFKYLQLCL
jgi:hypothetical protein